MTNVTPIPRPRPIPHKTVPARIPARFVLDIRTKRFPAMVTSPPDSIQFRFPIFFARAGIINAIRKESRVGIVIRREAIPSLFK